ncbi:ASG_G0027090.mRNA.1.CDS.1 [Saccharomyces cerevisiae]|nr:Y55_G0053970.mRNA.1.CDS.1 [Saccharomyces cerevisiae]CAI4390844.1 ASG_G0027090.mRNA.1.CDS.1 [Saccharomyces cerevisiae]CAI4407757.1 ALS_1a_G0028080.mRNA.1.CDS.1 [Saccharomyces cerevisiae]CAI4413005.1 CBK_G0027600.mRNA.1.CDS.1 [Saccharomyces cerevisiae]CAI5257723.1 BPK_HP2_G0025680.mRNA.1.CDS.1 [Saccharomyces cerevisiae]
MHKGASQWKITTGESRCRENRQIGGKTWSLISSLFHLNETLASALHHPYETLALYEAYFALREKKFLL